MTWQHGNPYRSPLDCGAVRPSGLGHRGCVAALTIVGIAFILIAAEVGFKLARAAWDAFQHPDVNYAISDPGLTGFVFLVLLFALGSGLAFVAAAWTVHRRRWKLTAWSLGAGLATAYYWGYLLKKAVLVDP
jgi:uncharacterized membrane protein